MDYPIGQIQNKANNLDGRTVVPYGSTRVSTVVGPCCTLAVILEKGADDEISEDRQCGCGFTL